MEPNSPQPVQQRKLPKWLTTVTPFSKALALGSLIVFPILGFYLGIYYSQSKNPISSGNVNTYEKVTQTPNQQSCDELNWQSDNNLPAEKTSNGFLLYRHTHNFQAYYQFEVSDKWAGYTVSNDVDKTTRTNFGPSHFWYQQENTVLDIPVTAYVTFGCDKKLVSTDPSKWSDTDYSKYFSSKDTKQTYTEINLGGISARKYLISSQAGEDANIYFTKGSMIFVIVVLGADDNTVNHVISTFKLLDKP